MDTQPGTTRTDSKMNRTDGAQTKRKSYVDMIFRLLDAMDERMKNLEGNLEELDKDLVLMYKDMTRLDRRLGRMEKLKRLQKIKCKKSVPTEVELKRKQKQNKKRLTEAVISYLD